MANAARKIKEPAVVIDWDRVGKLLEAGSTVEGVAVMLGVPQEALHEQCPKANGVDFVTYAQQRAVKGSELLKVKQFQLAMSGDKSMLRSLQRTTLKAVPASDSATDVERLSISQLGESFDLDRATVRKRIQEAGIDPVEVKAKLTLYELTPRLISILSNVKSPINEARLRKETAAAEKIEMQNAVARGELVPMAEVVEIVQSIVSKIYQELNNAQGKRIDNKLAKARTVIEVKKIRTGDNQRILKMLRANFTEFVK